MYNKNCSLAYATIDVTTFLLDRQVPEKWLRIRFPRWWPTIACDNIRFSSLFAAGDVSRRGTFAKRPQRRRERRNGCFRRLDPDLEIRVGGEGGVGVGAVIQTFR